ncbi:MAG: ribosome-associated translation inhibitor RaiA [Candidatus Atribacteria bacterium]|nr:ribosome-associated translation inhibitor RaiA [Candidatus Atribacteria bacterium]
MKLTIKGKHLDVTSSIESYIQKKMEKLDKYFDQIKDATATVSIEKNRHIFEVTLQAKRAIIRAEEESDDMYASIDRVIEKLERQIIKYKEKLYTKSTSDHDLLKDAIISESKESDIDLKLDHDVKIVKTKKFVIKPMSPEEASLQMELLGHSFYVFNNEVTNQINVIYRRKDGNLGLIEPEV